MIHSRPALSLETLALVLLAAGAAAGQTPAALGEPLVRSQEGFTHVFDVAELDDHRILFTDNLETAIVVMDLGTGAVERIGRQGGGPREYRSVFNIDRFGGDTLGVYDARQTRFLLVVDGAPVATRPFPRPPTHGFGVPRGPDAGGGFWFTSREIGPRGLERAERVYRWLPGRDSLILVDSIMAYGPDQARRGVIPMPRGDGWSLRADGSVVRVSAESYRLDRTTPDGRSILGPPIPHDPIPVTAAERDAWLRELASAPAASVQLRDPDPEPGGDHDPELARRRREYPASSFPEFVPPFERGWLPIAPDGELWITRNGPAGADHTAIDVIAPDGSLATRFRVDGRVRVIGVTGARVYLARKDAYDVEWLEVYRRP